MSLDPADRRHRRVLQAVQRRLDATIIRAEISSVLDRTPMLSTGQIAQLEELSEGVDALLIQTDPRKRRSPRR
jgi:hypothetical protein